jgi:hypothetical protein
MIHRKQEERSCNNNNSKLLLYNIWTLEAALES